MQPIGVIPQWYQHIIRLVLPVTLVWTVQSFEPAVSSPWRLGFGWCWSTTSLYAAGGVWTTFACASSGFAGVAAATCHRWCPSSKSLWARTSWTFRKSAIPSTKIDLWLAWLLQRNLCNREHNITYIKRYV